MKAKISRSSLEVIDGADRPCSWTTADVQPDLENFSGSTETPDTRLARKNADTNLRLSVAFNGAFRGQVKRQRDRLFHFLRINLLPLRSQK